MVSLSKAPGEGLKIPLFVREGHASAWRPWFAWRPVWVCSLDFPYPREQLVWLRWIERRRFYPAPWFLLGVVADTSWPEYRFLPRQGDPAAEAPAEVGVGGLSLEAQLNKAALTIRRLEDALREIAAFSTDRIARERAQAAITSGAQ